MTHSEPARTTTRPIRIRKIRVAILLVVIAAIAAALGYQLLASSSSTAASPIDAKYRLCQIYSNEPWHYELRPEAIGHGCPPIYADPTHDPRMSTQSPHAGRKHE